LDRADELLLGERSQKQPPALLDLDGNSFESAAKYLTDAPPSTQSTRTAASPSSCSWTSDELRRRISSSSATIG
jgi:hypothetical protein